MAATHQLLHLFAEQRNLRRGNGTVAQTLGYGGYAAQFAEGLEHHHLRLLQSLRLDALLDGHLVVLAALLVELGVAVVHLDVECLLRAVGQLLEHVLLQASQHEGENLAAQGLRSLLVGTVLYGAGILLVEVVERAEHRGIEEAVEGVKLRQVVLYRRTAQCQAVLAVE